MTMPGHLKAICLGVLLATGVAWTGTAAEAPEAPKEAVRIASIKLNDGTTVRGQVKGLKDGFYLIETVSLGELKVSAQRIVGISYEPPAATREATPAKPKPAAAAPLQPKLPPPGAGFDNDQMQSLMQQMLGNPEVMKLMEQLSQDPAVQKMVTDPELQKAIEGGNYLQLLQHPSIRTLLDNPTVKQISGEVKAAEDAPPAPATPQK